MLQGSTLPAVWTLVGRCLAATEIGQAPTGQHPARLGNTTPVQARHFSKKKKLNITNTLTTNTIYILTSKNAIFYYTSVACLKASLFTRT